MKHYQYSNYSKEIMELIGVSEKNKVNISDITNNLNQLDHEITSTFKKGISREIDKIIDEVGGGLIKTKGGYGKKTYYFWKSDDAKSSAIEERESNPFLQSVARAMAYSFVEEHLTDFLPPKYIEELEYDFNRANRLLAEREDFREKSDEYKSKLIFRPLGYDLRPKNLDEKKHIKTVYEALDKEWVVSADYDSIHDDYIGRLHLSPQRIVYLNHQILLQCYVHDVDSVKHFDIARLNNIKIYEDRNYSFRKIDLLKYEKKYAFKAKVHSWVKNYFDNVRLGPPHETKTPVQLDDVTWMIESKITLPIHFNGKNKPDTFFFANFLGMYFDSMEVIDPVCLRDEMIRRTIGYRDMYLENCNK